MYQIHQQDIGDWAKEYTGPKAMACLCDPPYHLTIPARFGKPDSKPPKGGVYKRTSAGFMLSEWDGLGESGKGIAFDPATWDALAEHLYPGAFIMAFAGSRGYHRMATAMEDAGLIIHPAMGWLTLSGFPKATRIKGYGSPAFKGHRYGLQALKPAFEFIAVAQVPYGQRPVDSIVATGAGALNIEQGRIPIGESDNIHQKHEKSFRTAKNTTFQGMGAYEYDVPYGRWPANFLLQHHPEDNGECHPDCPVRLFDEQAGESTSTGGVNTGGLGDRVYGKYAKDMIPESAGGYGDSGPASRMFFQAEWAYEVAEQLANAEPVRYEPKVSSSEREVGLDDLETRTRHRVNAGGLENEPRFAPTQVKNNHPCLKPISLVKYLCTLLSPPAAYAPRRILIPFAGSGSEICGAILSGGFEEIIGIEREANYVKIAQARCEWWSQWPGWGQTDVDAILAAAKRDATGQMSLFSDEVARRGQAG